MPRGGPDGGDGGRGGDVVLVADRNLATLMDHRYQREFKAGHGEPGGTNQRSGSDGAEVVVRVPVGTTVYDADAPGSAPLCDFVAEGQRWVAARGGRGGWGNQHFATATRQTPEFAKPGLPGTRVRLRLSLKLLADVGLVGLPNAGKSTLLSRVSAARPKVARLPLHDARARPRRRAVGRAALRRRGHPRPRRGREPGRRPRRPLPASRRAHARPRAPRRRRHRAARGARPAGRLRDHPRASSPPTAPGSRSGRRSSC